MFSPENPSPCLDCQVTLFVQLVFSHKTSPVNREFVVALTFVVSGVFRHGWIDLHLALQSFPAQTPFSNL